MIAILPIALLALLVLTVLEKVDGHGISRPRTPWQE